MNWGEGSSVSPPRSSPLLAETFQNTPSFSRVRKARRAGAERAAINAPMQGSAADIIKRAMIDIYNWLPTSGLDARMLLQVHDELVFEVHHKDVELVSEGVNFRMMTAASLSVPLIVDIGIGANWDEAH